MNHQLICKAVEELPSVAKEILTTHADKKIFAFNGSMGAGKTTLIKAICAYLKVEDIVNSPTFSIVNEYFTTENNSIYHFGFYRIKKTEEVMDIGYEEYLYSGNYCFLEWPEMIEELLPENIVYVSIEEDSNNGFRIINF
jgi:tRNA threonylcarbamoyladenosine biosynthesis protein TsaE